MVIKLSINENKLLNTAKRTQSERSREHMEWHKPKFIHYSTKNKLIHSSK